MSSINRYSVFHFILGLFSNDEIDKIFMLYQGGQLILNKKVFLDKGIIEEGQTFNNTFKKLTEYSIGRYIGRKIYTDKKTINNLLNVVKIIYLL